MLSRAEEFLLSVWSLVPLKRLVRALMVTCLDCICAWARKSNTARTMTRDKMGNGRERAHTFAVSFSPPKSPSAGAAN
ncbi:hypothetical protein BDN72DRAFT_842997 [Pluteus cervinus]|uniref:Uncharacterized protein n=1 Tax=Pluteus cervinus TaxID=181527 RepID=A0ACD3AQ98_9AGAR|nr:hypothetical protein BDN72DRAFT_842997 [Pluteus cervinus]